MHKQGGRGTQSVKKGYKIGSRSNSNKKKGRHKYLIKFTKNHKNRGNIKITKGDKTTKRAQHGQNAKGEKSAPGAGGAREA